MPLTSLALAGKLFTTSATWEALIYIYKTVYINVYIKRSHFAEYLKITQYCKSTIFHLKIFFNPNGKGRIQRIYFKKKINNKSQSTAG